LPQQKGLNLYGNNMGQELRENLKTRNCKPSDHPRIIGVLKDWWGGRDLTWMLPRLFLIHFGETSLSNTGDIL